MPAFMKLTYSLLLVSFLSIPSFLAAGPAKGKPPLHLAATVLNSTTVKLNWMGTPKDYAYRVRVRPVGVLTWTEYVVAAPSCTRRISDLEPGTPYQWQVQTMFSKSPRDTSAFTNGPTFRPWEPCETPQGLIAMTESTSKVALIWYPAGDGVRYHVRLREESNKEWTSYTTDQNVLVVNGLEPHKGYEWYVSADCANGDLESEKSEKSFFATSPDVLYNAPIGNYGDYARDRVLTFNVYGNDAHEAVLQNQMGQCLGKLPVYYTASNGTVAFNVENDLPPGLYNVSYRCGDSVQSQTLHIAGDF